MLFGEDGRSDPRKFHEVYLKGLELPADMVGGWKLHSVEAEPDSESVGQSIDLVMKTEEGDVLTVYVARSAGGSECFARTRYLDVSYYGDYQEAEPESVVSLLNFITKNLADAEADGLEEEGVNEIFGPPTAPPPDAQPSQSQEDRVEPQAQAQSEGDSEVDDSGDALLGMLEEYDDKDSD